MEEAAIDLSSRTLGAIRRTSAVDTVRARIALAVEAGLVASGDRLPSTEETAIAFGVSEMTVRRAFAMLRDEGVLIRRRGNAGGTFISDSPPTGTVTAVAEYRADAEHVRALIDQRAVIETGLAHLAAGARVESELKVLAGLVERMRGAANWAEYREADVEFHDRVAAAARSDAAAALHRRISRELYGYFLPYPLEYLHRSNEEHGDLVDALTARDAARAGAITYAHVTELHTSMYVGLNSH